MDVNKPIENPVLVELLDNLKTQFNADTEHKFFKELLSAKFLSPITQDSLQGCKNGESALKVLLKDKYHSTKDSLTKKYFL